jgi:hypothetical protein
MFDTIELSQTVSLALLKYFGLLVAMVIPQSLIATLAVSFGDKSLEYKATINPVPHMSVVGSVLLPFFCFLTNSPILFGWPKPVYPNIQNFYYTKRYMYSNIIYAAPLFLPFVISIVMAIILCLLRHMYPNSIESAQLLYMTSTSQFFQSLVLPVPYLNILAIILTAVGTSAMLLFVLQLLPVNITSPIILLLAHNGYKTPLFIVIKYQKQVLIIFMLLLLLGIFSPIFSIFLWVFNWISFYI